MASSNTRFLCCLGQALDVLFFAEDRHFFWVVTFKNPHRDGHKKQFQCPHGLELLRGLISSHSSRMHSFNALMGLSCYANTQKYTKQSEEFQCPLGLIPHFYKLIPVFIISQLIACQCPLGLIPHFYGDIIDIPFAQVAPCQCPLGLIPHFYNIWQS